MVLLQTNITVSSVNDYQNTNVDDTQALEGNAAENAALQDIHYILRSNGLECRSIGLPIPNNPMLINPVRNVNEEASHGANIPVSYTHLDVYKRQLLDCV